MSNSNCEGDITENVKQLAEAVSTQTKVANKTWLTTMIVALLILFPPINKDNPQDNVTLLFNIATVNATIFYPVVFAVLSVLIVAFSSAHAQAVRAQKLAHKSLNKINTSALFGIHPKDYFDMAQSASVNRVAPLAQLVRGKFQFRDNSNSCPKWLILLTSIYYLFLKIIAAVVFLLLPAFAYWKAYQAAIDTQNVPNWSIIFLAIIGFSSLIVVAISDFQYVINTFGVLLGTLKNNSESKFTS
ncbi:MAG: hypothetical protein A2V66_17580 [Ignavibacteria bacterium RBG_13_36_8]|nr:MAG: hypothetical protein A2V66_17580 [Ignavibacteria bacterium RBG_13_36_8]